MDAESRWKVELIGVGADDALHPERTDELKRQLGRTILALQLEVLGGEQHLVTDERR